MVCRRVSEVTREEKTDVAAFMVSVKGMDRNSHIAGRSVHNQSSLEDEGLLSPDNDVHIFALHWVFLPRLQHHLDCFVDGWNSHPLRTERNRSPLQLWHANIDSEASPNPPEVDDLYGVEWRGPHARDARDAGIVVPDTLLPREVSQDEIDNLVSQPIPPIGIHGTG
ncbi:hypothetical protein SKAU_G00095030 [Synaphobranchus kaupii]|uniref:Integrase core domain-containing protein n=1 Tax=Synaphobranchus kaupii TaxID=118154 RepID=A0A9Q1FYB7_SYNKA|nr:hypothetical protein SKAU_G00095030 [Synaphobranchus kaupii]